MGTLKSPLAGAGRVGAGAHPAGGEVGLGPSRALTAQPRGSS